MMPTAVIQSIRRHVGQTALQCLFGAAALTVNIPGSAQVVGFALEPKAELVNGVIKPVLSPQPDRAVFFQFTGAKFRKIGEVAVPTNFQGPPSSVAVSADGALALVSAAQRIDPQDASKFSPDNRVSVIDLNASPIRVTQTLELTVSPASLAMNPAGTMVLAMHPGDDSVTVLQIDNKTATVVEKVSLGKGSGPNAAAFTPDGRSVLITRGGDHKVSVFAIENHRLAPKSLRDMGAGLRPLSLSLCGKTGYAVVGSMGLGGTGDADTVSLIDMTAAPARVVDTVTVGQGPEGIACAPDGRHAVVAFQNGSNRPTQSPFYAPSSKVVLLKVEGKRLHRLAELPIGIWSQGALFLDDSRTVIAESLDDRALHLLQIDDGVFQVAAPPIVFAEGGPMAHGVAGR